MPSSFTTLSTGVPSRPARQRGPTRCQSIDHSGRYASPSRSTGSEHCSVRRATNARRLQVPGRIPVEPRPSRFGTKRSGICVFVFRTAIAEDGSVVTAPNKVVDDIDHPGNSSVADDQSIPDVEEPASKTFAGFSPTVHDAMDDIQGVDRPRPPFPVVEDHPHVDVVDLVEGHPGIGDEADLVTIALDAVERPVPHPVSPNYSAAHSRCQPTWPGSNGLVPSTTGRCRGSQLPAEAERAIVGQRRALPHRSFPHEHP